MGELAVELTRALIVDYPMSCYYETKLTIQYRMWAVLSEGLFGGFEVIDLLSTLIADISVVFFLKENIVSPLFKVNILLIKHNRLMWFSPTCSSKIHLSIDIKNSILTKFMLRLISTCAMT
jgi:hypothetical protein